MLSSQRTAPSRSTCHASCRCKSPNHCGPAHATYTKYDAWFTGNIFVFSHRKQEMNPRHVNYVRETADPTYFTHRLRIFENVRRIMAHNKLKLIPTYITSRRNAYSLNERRRSPCLRSLSSPHGS